MDSTKRAWRRRFNEGFFFTWSDSLAWLIGLIWSDGCLSYNTVKFGCKDRDLMETVAALIDIEGGVRISSQGAFCVAFSSQRVADFLRGMGLTERKSLTIGWPVGLPVEYEAAFARGLLDGDGCFSLRASKLKGARQLTILFTCGSLHMTEAYEAWLDRQGISYTRQERQQRVSWHVVRHTIVRAQPDVRRLCVLLYPDPGVLHLARKRSIYEEWAAERGTSAEWAATVKARMSEASKRMWQDPEYRAKIEATKDRLFADDVNASRGRKQKERWEDPEYRGRLLNARAGVWDRPGYRERVSASMRRARAEHPRPKLDRWAVGFDACKDCGRTDRKHRGHGLCRTCYQARVRHRLPPDT